MAQKTLELKAKTRTEKGTRAARHFRTGKPALVPAVLYGGRDKDGKALAPQHLVVGKEDLNLLLKKHGLLIDLQVEGGKKEVAIIKEVQKDALQEFVMHVDFERVDLNKPIHVDVTVTYKGTPKGLTKGGHLRIESYTLKLEALPLAIPEEIVVHVDDVDLDQVLRLKDIKLPEGVKALEDPEHALCAVRAAVEEKEPVAGAAEGPAEPEVIGLQSKEKEGEEGAAAEKEKK